MIVIVVVVTLFVLTTIFLLATIITFNNQVKQTRAINSALARNLKIKMLAAGIVYGITVGVFDSAVEGLRDGICMGTLYSVIIGFGLMRVASRTISKLKRKHQRNDS